MTTTLLIVAIILLLAVLGLQVAALLRKTPVDQEANERTERAVREEIARNRDEASKAAQQSRQEVATTLKNVGDSLDQRLGAMRETIEKRLGVIQEESGKKLDQVRQESTAGIQKSREEVTVALKTFNESVGKTITDFVDWQRGQFASIIDQQTKLTESNEKRLGEVRTAVEEKLKAIQEDNAKNLEQMRLTVDEKLQGTLDKRLSESFKSVSERLEQVYKGLGEMQALAVGVGDLKRVLTNVKARGTWGEVQLERMLEQVLNPDQYDKNVSVPPTPLFQQQVSQ